MNSGERERKYREGFLSVGDVLIMGKNFKANFVAECVLICS